MLRYPLGSNGYDSYNYPPPCPRDIMIEAIQADYPHFRWSRVDENSIQGIGLFTIVVEKSGSQWRGCAGADTVCVKSTINEVIMHLFMILLPKMQALVDATMPKIKARLRESGMAKLTEEEKIALGLL